MMPVVVANRCVRTAQPARPPGTTDPLPTMRRELKLLQIEIEQLHAVEGMLRTELDLVRAAVKDEAERQTKEFLLRYLEQVRDLRESRDYWEREAKRLMAQNQTHWSMLWRTRGGIAGQARPPTDVGRASSGAGRLARQSGPR